MQKIIFHIDMNAYFASVEEILNPKLINKPLIVSGYSKKSVVSCPNYIARKYGIKAAMPVYKAIQLCPTVNICIPKMKEYQRFHNKFISIIKTKLSNLIEIVGIDECYVDVTHLSNKTEPIKLAKMIQNKIFTTTGLKSSIGISSNKFLAKMASDLKKPMGISTLFQNEIQEKIWPLDVGDMFMIGKKTAQVLKDQGINTIGDLANYDEKILSKLLNKNFLEYKAMANGFGSDVLDLEGSDPKSIGTSMTFNNNTNYFDEIKAVLSEQIHEIWDKLNQNNMKSRTITLTIKDTNFKVSTRSITIDKYFDSYEEILFYVIDLYEKNFNGKTIRLVGVSLNNLVIGEQYNLFNFDKKITKNKINKNDAIINEINNKFKKEIIFNANKILK